MLLAFCAAQVLAQIPITPGGLGFVEAGLTGTLTLDRRVAGGGGARHLRVPALLLLAAAPGGPGRVRVARAALRGRIAHHPSEGEPYSPRAVAESNAMANPYRRNRMSDLVAIAYPDLATAQEVAGNVAQAPEGA